MYPTLPYPTLPYPTLPYSTLPIGQHGLHVMCRWCLHVVCSIACVWSAAHQMPKDKQVFQL